MRVLGAYLLVVFAYFDEIPAWIKGKSLTYHPFAISRAVERVIIKNYRACRVQRICTVYRATWLGTRADISRWNTCRSAPASSCHRSRGETEDSLSTHTHANIQHYTEEKTFVIRFSVDFINIITLNQTLFVLFVRTAKNWVTKNAGLPN